MAEIDEFIASLTVSDTPKRKAWFGIIYGEPGLNKNGGCVYAPDPFLIGLDQNAAWMPVKSYRNADGELIIPKERYDKSGTLVGLSSYEQFWQMMIAPKKKAFRASLSSPMKTIIIDNTTDIQKIFKQQVVRSHPTFKSGGKNAETSRVTTCIEDLGYDGRGYMEQHWDKLLVDIQSYLDYGFNVILLAHEVDANYTDQHGDTYKIKNFGLTKYGEININAKIYQKSDWCVALKKNTTTKTVGSGKWSKKVGIGGSEPETIIQCYSDTIRNAKVNGIGMDEFPLEIGFHKYNRPEIWAIFFEMINGDFSRKSEL